MSRADKETTKVIYKTDVHRETVKRVEASGASFNATARQEYNRTGQLPEMVNVYGKIRKSRDIYLPVADQSIFTLPYGVKMPVISLIDGTGSMGTPRVKMAFQCMGDLFSMLKSLGLPYQWDLAVGICQDYKDKHPVFQMSEWESSNIIDSHTSQLIPDNGGKDTTEDYQYGLWYIDQKTEIDIIRRDLLGYLFLGADADSRETLDPDQILQHLGHNVQEEFNLVSICQSLCQKWHFFLLNVGGEINVRHWWEQRMGSGHVVDVLDINLMAVVQVGLIYAMETLQPNRDGLAKIIAASNLNIPVESYQIDNVWSWLTEAKIPFGAQARRPNHSRMKELVSAKFSNDRDIWPIENVETIASTAPKINWNKF